MTVPAALLATVFLQPIPVGGLTRLLMLVPLAASISVVYKTIRCENVREVPRASVVLCLTIVTGMMLIGIILLTAFRVMV